MKYAMIFLALLMTGCAAQLEEVKELNQQNHKVNKIERKITKERASQVALSSSVAVAQDEIAKSKQEMEALEVELEKEKAILMEMVK